MKSAPTLPRTEAEEEPLVWTENDTKRLLDQLEAGLFGLKEGQDPSILEPSENARKLQARFERADGRLGWREGAIPAAAGKAICARKEAAKAKRAKRQHPESGA